MNALRRVDTLKGMLSSLEGVIQKGSLGGSGAKVVVFFLSDVVIAIGSSLAAKGNGQGALFGVVVSWQR
jgi:mannose/fructose/N-acetylgalactosamine-specific phosphotransferase system component IID